MLKRTVDILASALGLIVTSPILIGFSMLVWFQDFHSPFYVADRVGRNGRMFKMVKLRSMSVGADKSGVNSTAEDDPRVTRVGRWIRSYKLDELTQLWNVLIGQMSLVGPRPQVKRDVDLYTETEMGLLAVRPGITDLSSIVFSDEGKILEGVADPDLAYNQLIRPWKSRLGILYVENVSIWLDLKLMVLTILAIINRASALGYVRSILVKLEAETQLVEICSRATPLYAYPPPGSTEIVTSRY